LKRALKVRNITATYSALSELSAVITFYPGATRFALAPGYHIPAPLALRDHIPRRWRCATVSDFGGKAAQRQPGLKLADAFVVIQTEPSIEQMV
jgi:hypothetical protein